MGKQVVVKFDKNSHKEYCLLQQFVNEGKKSKKKPTHQQLLDSINKAINNIHLDYKYGNLIPRKYLSKTVIERYGTDKIFRVELIGYWRLLYTLIGSEVEIIAFILEYMDHKRYNKIFNYRKH